ncbi:MarR family transcriptional regulator [Paenibacillus sp. MWE-103]|uniref:MarR family transcriptional regulator n=1 Tax=Paenibacillus artemisiicola TaxID=1172618 RepID=A0ABS3WEU7_9BACL|nr:MarR family transcriptional regulator [Paenibacillus artemisiicola]MBO7746851.1 MarR family transcriptional regulator [Paenibacillus artemisiicola]
MNHESAPQPGALTIADGLAQLSFLVHGILGRAGAEHDLSIIQIRLLGILRDREPSMLQLARFLNLDKSSITGLVDRAERRGLVERVADAQDRRGFRVRLTDAGRQLVRSAGGEIERGLMAAVQGLDEAERAQLAAIAGKIIAQATAARE